MKQEQLRKIFKNSIEWHSDGTVRMKKTTAEIIDEILTLSLDLPDDDWVKSNCPYSLSKVAIAAFEDGAEAMKDEILKRNT